MVYQNTPIQVVSGVQPDTDFTQQSTPHWVESDKIRFVDGFPEKIGGWKKQLIQGNFSVQGCPRNIFSYIALNNTNYMIGTHTHLYNLLGSTLTNITPVLATTTTLNNVLSTFFGTLANDPIATTSGSNVITITDTAHKLTQGDAVSLTGSTAVNGIPAVEINTGHTIGNVTTNSYDITVTTSATSTGSGGGAAVVRATRIVSVADVNDFADGDNVVISNLGVTVGGIIAGDINGIRRIQSVTGTGYNIVADSFATSSVSGVGGSIDVAEQIPDGTCDPTTGAGYGLGLYGVGLYGVSKTASVPTLPSIWSFDKFGNLVISTQGNQTGLFSWDTSISTLPELVTNAPTVINYVFVSNEIAVTFGADDVGNRIQWSDQGALTTWTPTPENRAGQDDIEGAGEFISHAQLRGFNLLFTREQVYSFRFINKPFVWETVQIDPARGLIARNARIVVNGICYWMGTDNFNMYRGGNVEIIPSNTISQSTVKKFVFDNLNTAQQSKIFAWYNEKFTEIWWHVPTGSSLDPDLAVTYNIRTGVWATHILDRTAAEYPVVLETFPRLIQINGDIFNHENGNDDDTIALPFKLVTPFFNGGTQPVTIGGLNFDSIRTGDITVKLRTKSYPKSTISEVSYIVADTVDRITFRQRGRFWQYEITGNVLDQSWRAGQWSQDLQASGRK